MYRSFEEKIDDLKNELLKMASAVEQALHNAIDALKKRDDELAKKVIAEDAQIDEFETRIDSACIELLALQTPVASDLRLITSAMKINNDLERMADHAVNIAQKTLELNREKPLKPLIDIPRMAELAQAMVKDAIDAFLHRDSQLALGVCKRDDDVDDLNTQVIRELMTYIAGDPTAVTRALGLIMISKNIERIADLATNIAEEVVFIVEGRSIKHLLGKKAAGQKEGK